MITHDKLARVGEISEKFLLLCIGASIYGPKVFVLFALGFLLVCLVTGFVAIQQVCKVKKDEEKT